MCFGRRSGAAERDPSPAYADSHPLRISHSSKMRIYPIRRLKRHAVCGALRVVTGLRLGGDPQHESSLALFPASRSHKT